jgi:hypothetical protein
LLQVRASLAECQSRSSLAGTHVGRSRVFFAGGDLRLRLFTHVPVTPRGRVGLNLVNFTKKEWLGPTFQFNFTNLVVVDAQ